MSGPAPAYEVHIGPFDGPMDLLLYLVQKNELHPKDISLAQIADQFAQWMESAQLEDLSDAGEFLVMTSRLMALKIRELLPKDQQSEVEQMEFDQDREKLIQQMLEYQRFKEVAGHLHELEANQVGTFYRGRVERSRSSEEDSMPEVSMWQLFKAFKKSVGDQSKRNRSVHTIEMDDVTIEDRQQYILNFLARHGRAILEDLLGLDTRPLVKVVTFMALMEMVKTEDIIIRQGETHGALWIYRRRNNAEFSEEMAQDNFTASIDAPLQGGVVDAIRKRNAELASQTTVSLDAVMREVQRRVADGQLVQEKDLLEMLSGTIDVFGEDGEENPLPKSNAEVSLAPESQEITIGEDPHAVPEIQETAIVEASSEVTEESITTDSPEQPE